MEWRPGPPPRACFVSDGEVEVANLLDHFRVAGCGSAGVPAEEREHEVLRRVEMEKRVAAFEVARLRLLCPLAILDGHAPLAAPWAGDVDAVRSVNPRGRLRFDLVLPEDERERQDQAGGRFIDRR